jgi:hypothetical protein
VQTRLVMLLVVIFVVFGLAQARTVFIAPHSHCDAGWIITFEQYYIKEVRNILNSVVDALWLDQKLCFNWAESGYLHRWFQDNDEARQAKLVQVEEALPRDVEW